MMSRSLRLLIGFFGVFCLIQVLACTHATAPKAKTPENPVVEAVSETSKPEKVPEKVPEEALVLPESLPEVLPKVLEGVNDEVAQVFACVEYNHITLLLETDRRDIPAVLHRLGELKTARALCGERVGRLFEKFPLFVESFRAEWRFYMTYFALTVEPSAVHNLKIFCERLGQTSQAAQEASRRTGAYHRWLAEEQRNSDTTDPYLKIMLTRATEKVSGLGAAQQSLQQQYRRECP